MEIFRVTPTTTGFHVDVDPGVLSWLKVLLLGGGALAIVGLLVLVIVPLISTRRRGSLINCRDCGGGVSPLAPACPHCGQAMK
jgi:hypothetical protein